MCINFTTNNLYKSLPTSKIHLAQQLNGHYISDCVSSMLIGKTIQINHQQQHVCCLFLLHFKCNWLFYLEIKVGQTNRMLKTLKCLILIEWACVALCLWPLAGWLTIIHNLVLELSWAVGCVRSGGLYEVYVSERKGTLMIKGPDLTWICVSESVCWPVGIQLCT